MLQETKSWEEATNRFKRTALKAGYCFQAAHAIGESRSSFSSGVMVAWRRHLCVSAHSTVPPTERYVAVTLRSTSLGEVVIGSLYLHQGTTLAQGGQADKLLMHVFGNLRELGAIFLIGGDFNHPPLLIAAWLEANAMPFLVVAQPAPTFVSRGGQSNIDFFIASREVALVMNEAVIITGSGLAGHSPIRTTWQKTLFNQKVAVWCRPKAPDPKPVYGPQIDPGNSENDINNIQLSKKYSPEEGAMRTIKFDEQLHQEALVALEQWTRAVKPTICANFGVEDIKQEGVVTKQTTLKQALKLVDKGQAAPRFAFRFARHLAATANAIANNINIPLLSAKEIKHMTHGIEQHALIWIHAIEDLINNNEHPTNEVAIRTVANALEHIARQDMQKAQAESNLDWQTTMKHLLQVADSKAFAYVKGAALISPEGDIIHFREHERNKWKNIWAGQDEATDFQETALLDGNLANNRPPLTPQELRNAAKSFSTKTSTADWWHPRLFGWLSDHQLDKLAQILFIWECNGRPAIPNDNLIIKMIPKPTGGFRPIGFFPSLVRLWGKARQSCVR